HGHRISNLLQQFLRCACYTFTSVHVLIPEIPAQQHDPRSKGIEFPHERNVIPVGCDEHQYIKLLENGKFVSLKCEPYVNPFFLTFSTAHAQWQVMCNYLFSHQDIVKYPFSVKLVFAA